MMKTTTVRLNRLTKVLLITSAIGICPCLAAAATPQELLDQCKAAIQKDIHASTTIETCLNAEKTIRSASPNSRENVVILEQLALMASYNNNKPQSKIDYYKQALEAARTGFGDQAPETFESRANLAAIAIGDKDWRGAREMYRQLAAAIKKQDSSTFKKREKSALDSITKTYRMEEKSSPDTYKVADHLKAERELLESLRAMNFEKDIDKRDIGSALLEIGFIEMGQGQLEQAEKDTTEALAIFQATYGGGFIDIASKQLERIRSMK